MSKEEINSIEDELDELEEMEDGDSEEFHSHDEVSVEGNSNSYIIKDGKKYYKRKFGSGTKRPTDEKKAQCPLCKMYYKRLNAAHLTSIHDMTLEELEKSDPEAAKFFKDPEYAILNSDYAKLNKVQEVLQAEQVKKIEIAEKQKEGVELVETEKAFSVILDDICQFFGMNRLDPNFRETPKRFAKAMRESLKGEKDTQAQLTDIFKSASQFPSDYPGIVVETNIRANGKCPHHFENIIYNIHIGYKPKTKKVGLSKLARAAEVLASRLKMQEDVTNDIAVEIMKHLDAEGVAVVVDAEHMCMKVRGAEQDHVKTTTSVMLGCFLYNPDIKNEFYRQVDRNTK